MQIYRRAGRASGSAHGSMVQVCFRLMSQLLKRQIERLEAAIERSTDWLEIQYLKAELDQLKDLYDERDADAA